MTKTEEQMQAAYRLAAALHLKRDPREAEESRSLSAEQLLVVRGHYDHAERVFDLAGIPYTSVHPEALGELSLGTEQMLFVNCRGDEWRYRWLAKAAEFVAKGGLLVTTDWSLGLLTHLFPEKIRRLGRPGAYRMTPNDVVWVEVREPDHPMLKAFAEVNEEPAWWLEGSSWLFEAAADVDVLISSREMEKKYGSGLVAVTWPHGEGAVIHMISHFYLQQTELRSARDSAPSECLMQELNVNPAEIEALAGVKADFVSRAAARDAYTSYRSTLGMLKAKAYLLRKRGEAQVGNSDGED